ncbi:tRNA pseudouridine(55) synthase [Corynebacterium kutscheri]|uniref:tRNA pseudouridine synthase B n=1 Tax=Corynebacterium kutscheri TaxID=35755 RepID=A0A0F6R002_9CORY|nr:tRNA pseudouridine(55) synthase TruB [Corynebacterium kutscheri]AKE41437.1 tRNA pseudouridine(55) synthase [Corynebacterium kutscheri]VEH09761.1 tRNA pseudouridine synthase B [Corynebacterium kutscheri]
MTDPLATSGLIIVDKPQDMTSHDVVARLRRIFHTRKIGHAGTLDPMATGVLVLGIERGTKFLAHMRLATKSYTATIRLGITTTTDDAEGEVLHSTNALHITDEQITAGVKKLTGEIMQRPSSVSAIKINGKRAHQLVREGQEVELPARPVTVSRFDITGIRREEFLDIDVQVDCSSGTYIRSLARDLGADLKVGGHLISLRRTSVGPYHLNDALTLDELADNPRLSLSLDQALQRNYPVLAVSESEAADLAMGKWLSPRGLKEVAVAVNPTGQSIALVREKGKRLSTIFVARPSTL